MSKKAKHPEDMTASELTRATRHFEEPFVFERGRPMSLTERAEEQRLRRPRRQASKASTRISIALSDELLRRADVLARRKGVNRAQFIASLVEAGITRRAV